MKRLMRFVHRPDPCILVLVAVVSLPAPQAQAVLAEQPTPLGDYLWLDVDGQPLPFQDHATIQDVMRSARVVGRQEIGRGITKPDQLVLEHDHTRFHVAFRSVDVSVRDDSSGARRAKRYRDAAIFECAAYEMSQLLGMGRVPPTVERRIDEQDGTVQLWLEEALPQDVLIERDKLQPPDLARWSQQRQVMYVFDSLIANPDRNQTNLMTDRSWNIWFIDHTRAFQRSSVLLNRDKLTGCERGLWDSLRGLDEDVVRERLEPYLKRGEISDVFKRRQKLIRHIQKLIDKNGEAAVLFDLRPPGADKADWND